MWRIFDPWRNERACEWRKIYNEVLKYLYSTPKIFGLIKSRRIKLAAHIACVGNWRVLYRGLVGKPEGKDPLGRPKRRGEIFLGWIFRKQDLMLCSNSR